MKRTVVRIGIVVAGLAVLLIAARALAERSFGPHAMHRRMNAFIQGALEAAKADPAQRKAIEAARDQAMTAIKGIHEDRRADMNQALDLFEADRLDGAKVTALKDARLGEMRRAGDAVVAALARAHDVLRPEQRVNVAEYIRSHKPSRGPGFRGDMMKRFATSRIDDLLEEIDANDAQKAAIEAARDHVFAAFDQNLANAEGDLHEKALALFSADRLDTSQVEALRSEHQQRAERVADAVVQGIHDVHDALTPAQRKQVADEVRSHAGRFHGHCAGGSHDG